MVIVRFNRWEEFVEELKGASPEDRVVRLTMSLRYTDGKRPYRTLVAGYVSREQIVEYVQYLGADPNGDRREETETLVEARKKALEGLGYKVRAGRHHVPPNVRR
jgi:hypothetical protein